MTHVSQTSHRSEITELAIRQSAEGIVNGEEVVDAFQRALDEGGFNRDTAALFHDVIHNANEGITAQHLDRIVQSSVQYAADNVSRNAAEAVAGALDLAASWIRPLGYNLAQRQELQIRLEAILAHSELELEQGGALGALPYQVKAWTQQVEAARHFLEMLSPAQPRTASVTSLAGASFRGGGEG